MNFGRQFLDFEGRRISGENPFLVAENLVELPSQLESAARRFTSGGAIGFWSYEAAQAWEPRAFPTFAPHQQRVPPFRLVFYEKLKFESLPTIAPISVDIMTMPDSPILRELYCGDVEKIKGYIAAGDIYQANMTHPFQMACDLAPEQIYERLRAFSAAPRAAFLEWDDFSVVSNSPETFLSLHDQILESKPIKGTIRRGKTFEEDELLKNELLESTKNRAENVMIVDLIRNDLGRCCHFGSIEVTELCALQTLPTLHHLVSTVRGKISPSCSPLQAFQDCFPCGSITGAPKIRAMQILSELENIPRGISMGAIGYFGFNGSMEWSVAIRTATFYDQCAYFRVGGGIVADSEATAEYDEMQLKARALYSAISNAGEATGEFKIVMAKPWH
ncbi:MAG TPA: aminodeoxychorismate synthase component I [Abditibacterium sp.]|jgi:para-aminobenzoate synthetase component 1